MCGRSYQEWLRSASWKGEAPVNSWGSVRVTHFFQFDPLASPLRRVLCRGWAFLCQCHTKKEDQNEPSNLFFFIPFIRCFSEVRGFRSRNLAIICITGSPRSFNLSVTTLSTASSSLGLELFLSAINSSTSSSSNLMKVQPWLTCWKHLYIVANQLSESQVSTLLAPPELHFSDRSSLEQLSRYALWSIVGRLKVQFSHIDSHLDKWIFIFPLSGRPSDIAFCNFFLKTTQLLVVKPLWLAFLHLRLGAFPDFSHLKILPAKDFESISSSATAVLFDSHAPRWTGSTTTAGLTYTGFWFFVTINDFTTWSWSDFWLCLSPRYPLQPMLPANDNWYFRAIKGDPFDSSSNRCGGISCSFNICRANLLREVTSVPLKLTAASSRVSAEQESLLIRPVMTNQSLKPGASAGKSQIQNCVCYVTQGVRISRCLLNGC